MELSDWLVAILKCALWDEKCYGEYPSSITCAFLDACTVLCKPSMSSSSILHLPSFIIHTCTCTCPCWNHPRSQSHRWTGTCRRKKISCHDTKSNEAKDDQRCPLGFFRCTSHQARCKRGTGNTVWPSSHVLQYNQATYSHREAKGKARQLILRPDYSSPTGRN